MTESLELSHTPEASRCRRDRHEAEVIRRLTALMRESDHVFKTVGGSTRHYVRDCLVPLLGLYGVAVVLITPEEPA